MEIDGIEVCKPIERLVDYLEKNNFTIVKQTVSDYHFHEVSIVMKGNYLVALDNIQIDDIIRINANLFACECNWSTVKIECK